MACVRCGAVCCLALSGDDGRYTGEVVLCYTSIPLTADVLKWLSKWPRVISEPIPALFPMPATWVRHDRHYLSSAWRCQDYAQLQQRKQELAHLVPDTSARERLVEAGYPEDPPPANLHANFAWFLDVWRALQFTAETEVGQLIEYANPEHPGCDIAAELLMSRADASAILRQTLESSNPRVRGATLALLRAAAEVSPALMLEQLNAVPMTPNANVPDRLAQWERFETLLIVLAERRMHSPEVLAGLRLLMRKVARHDPWLVDKIRTVIRVLESTPL
jgi:hypothetical protein